MSDESLPQSEIILYQTEDGRTRIQCRFENENVWMTQALMAELFQTTPQNITLHLRAIYAAGELSEPATCKDYLQVRSEGGRQIQRSLAKTCRAALMVGRAYPRAVPPHAPSGSDPVRKDREPSPHMPVRLGLHHQVGAFKVLPRVVGGLVI